MNLDKNLIDKFVNITSAAAVASSSRDAFAMSMPDKSEIIVWKFSKSS